jgi:hypothetical protein
VSFRGKRYGGWLPGKDKKTEPSQSPNKSPTGTRRFVFENPQDLQLAVERLANYRRSRTAGSPSRRP